MDKFSTVVSAVGPLTREFVEAGILVFFGLEAPEELRDFAILHVGGELASDIEVGDQLCINGKVFRILAVGEVANQNLRSLGHFVVKFNGRTVVEMPGDICAEANPLPEIQPGSIVRICSSS